MAQAFMIPSTDMLNAFHQNALISRPEGKRLTQLEQEMANILSRTDLTDRQKMEQFGYTIQKFQKIRGDIIEKGGFMITPESAPADPADGISQKVFEKIQGIIQQAIQADSTHAPAATSAPGPSRASHTPTTPANSRNKKINAKRLYAQKTKKMIKQQKRTKPRMQDDDDRDEDEEENDQQDENSPLLPTPGASAAAPKKGLLARSKEALRNVFSPMRTRAAARFADSRVNFSAWDTQRQ